MIKRRDSIELDVAIIRREELLAIDFDGEVAMMDVERGIYYGMDSIGSRIWGLLAKPMTIRDLINQLILIYDVDRETCQEHVHEFVLGLLNRDLILIN